MQLRWGRGGGSRSCQTFPIYLGSFFIGWGVLWVNPNLQRGGNEVIFKFLRRSRLVGAESFVQITRQHLNAISTFQFVQSRKQPVYIFMASHHSTDPPVHIDEWRSLTVIDHRGKSPGPGLFLLTKDMPIVINQNLYTLLGIVNGKEAIGVDVVIDESAKVYKMWSRAQPLIDPR